MQKLINTIFNKAHQLLGMNKVVAAIWFVIPLIATYYQTIKPAWHNNYLIYKGVFVHTLHQTNLYSFYPSEYFDKNHYGILFSLVIAPFYYLPDWLGIMLYQALQLFALYSIIRVLPLQMKKQNALLLFLLFEAIANCQNIQTNTFIAFAIIAAFVWIYHHQEAKAAFIIAFSFLIKLYGIVGLGLFFFVKRKPQFVLYGLISLLVLFCLPMLITSPQFNVQSYVDWWLELQGKNETNANLNNIHQNLSVLGMATKISGNLHFNYLFIIVPAFILQCFPLLRWRMYSPLFQLKYLSSLLLFLVLFNTATEASTYIIGASGVGIWWLTSSNVSSKKMLALILFVFIAGTLSTTDLVPQYINYELARKYSLKAFPYLIVWCICVYQLCLYDFKKVGYTLWKN